MFDIDGAIAAWQDRLFRRGAFTQTDLLEMEMHVREEVKRLMIFGLTEQEAFFQAVKEFGDDGTLAWRFNQARWDTVYVKRALMTPLLLGNYVKVAIRNLWRQKIYAAINVTGLAVGLSCAILISLFIFYELSFDRHHVLSDRIYRVLRETSNGATSSVSTATSGALADALRRDFPEVLQTVRVHEESQPFLVKYADKAINQQVIWADKSIFDVFTLPFVLGHATIALEEPYSTILTQEAALKIFGNQNPIGEKVEVVDSVNGNVSHEYRVTGVIANIPKTSTLQFDCVISTLLSELKNKADTWSPVGQYRAFETYVLLPKGYDAVLLENKLPDLMERYMGAEARASNTYHLQPLKRMHVYHHRDYGQRLTGYGDIMHIYMFAAVGGLVLVIASINFMNLSTARATNRVREVGLRKVVGARRSQLIGQFMGESVLVAFLSLGIALALAQLALPHFVQFTHRPLTLNVLNGETGLFLVGFTLLVGILAGSYPAFYLSSFQPMDVFKSLSPVQSGRIGFRQGMVVFQFAISAVLIVGTLVVYKQLHYIQTKNLGFDKERVVILPLDRRLAFQYQTVKQAFLTHPNVLKATVTRFPQGTYVASGVFRAEGSDQDWQMAVFDFDEAYLDFFGIDLLQGDPVRLQEMTAKSIRRDKDAQSCYLLNESAVKWLGWENAIGKQFGSKNRNPGIVVGVVRDFHLQSLHDKIQPAAFMIAPGLSKHLYLKLGTNKMPETLAFIEAKWQELLPDRPFTFQFLDERMSQISYENDIRVGRIFSAIALLAIGVACLGLLGLVAFMTEKRRKEIGIRKVVGASVSTIVLLLTKELLALVVIANVLAWPVAWYVMNHWLQNFAYRIDLDVSVFLLCGVLSLAVAALTVGFQAFNAATRDPVDALRSE